MLILYVLCCVLVLVRTLNCVKESRSVTMKYTCMYYVAVIYSITRHYNQQLYITQLPTVQYITVAGTKQCGPMSHSPKNGAAKKTEVMK